MSGRSAGTSGSRGYYIIEVAFSGVRTINDLTRGAVDRHRMRFDTAAEAEAVLPSVAEWVADRDRDQAERAQTRQVVWEAEQAAKKAAAARRPYRLRRSELYGTGRVYDDLPGATHYLGADGRYSVQIWDGE